MRCPIRSLATVLLISLVPGGSEAQVTETPIAFDSASKVRTLTPALVARFGLMSPAWPVQGTFREARLFAVSSGGRILAVERQSGAVDRYPFSDEDALAVRSAIERAMAQSGMLVTEDRAELISEPARGAFVRNQMGLTWGVYGPLLSSLTNDAKTGTALYLFATGASYFITTGIGKKTSVTRAQNTLSTDGALRGAGIAAGALYAFGGDSAFNDDIYAGVALAGAVAGTVAGFQLGRGRTDSEAAATTTVSTLSALTALGIGATFAGFDNNANDGRGVIAATVASGIAGYALGPSYPRKSRYSVTRGDVHMLSVGAILGAALAITPFASENADAETVSGAATAGMLGGVLFADRMLVRRFDYTSAEATQVGLGLAAGALLGGGMAVLTEPSDPRAVVGLLTAGAIAGTMAGHALADPARAGRQRFGLTQIPARRVGAARVEVNPSALVLGLAGVPGQHSLVSLKF